MRFKKKIKAWWLQGLQHGGRAAHGSGKALGWRQPRGLVWARGSWTESAQRLRSVNVCGTSICAADTSVTGTGATFRGAYGHSDGLGFYSTYNGKTIESLSCFFNETFQTYQKCTEPHFNT